MANKIGDTTPGAGASGPHEIEKKGKTLRGRKTKWQKGVSSLIEPFRKAVLAPAKEAFIGELVTPATPQLRAQIGKLHNTLGGRELDLKTESGIPVKAMVFVADEEHKQAAQRYIVTRPTSAVEGPPSPQSPTVIFLSGSDASVFAGDYESTIAAYMARGINVAIVDYPGVGLSGGSFSVKNSYEAPEALIQHLVSQGVSESKILIEGYSMGSGPATHLAAHHPETTLLLRCPFVKMSEIGTRTLAQESHVPKPIAKALTPLAQFALPYDNEKMMKNVEGHVGLIIANDEHMFDTELDTAGRLERAYKGQKGFSHYPANTLHMSQYATNRELATAFDQFLTQAGITKPVVEEK